MLERASCGVCGADDAFLLFVSPDLRRPDPELLFPVVRCRRCGHVYVLRRPTRSDIAGFYPADYAEHRRTDQPARRSRSKRHRRLRLLAGQRVLDVGCGSGYDLLRLKDRGCALFGIEPSPEAAGQARANGITVFQGSAEDADFPSAHFHQVTMNHCIEHFHDPGAALANIRRMTHPEGSLYLTFPTADGANFRLFREDWRHLDVPRHLHFFTHRSFDRLARRSGWRIIHRGCSSGTRGFRHSLGILGRHNAMAQGLARVASARPWSLIVQAALRLADLLRQGDVAEFVLKPGPCPTE